MRCSALDQQLAAIQRRLQELEPAMEEYRRLIAAERALTGEIAEPAAEVAGEPAPRTAHTRVQGRGSRRRR